MGLTQVDYETLTDEKHSNLAPAIEEVEVLSKRRKQWPPVNSGVHRQAKGLQGVIDDELGYLD